MLFSKSKNQFVEPVKRGRGRPRKYPIENQTEAVRPVDNAASPLKLLHNTKLIKLILILILAAIPSIYFYHKSQTTITSQDTNTKIQAVQKKIAKHILLPTDETPSLIEPLSQDQINKLATQAFFKQAKPGDEVLVYSRAGRAILYRPSIDRVIEMAPLNAASTAQ